MASIGIIANPASGKDIRRLVSYATTIDNNEKVNICKRIVLAAQGLGVESAYKLLTGQGKQVAPTVDTSTQIVDRNNLFSIDSQKALFAFEQRKDPS